MTASNQWRVPDEVHDALAAEFDGSLSDLDMELGTSSSNVNGALIAVPDINSRKQGNKHQNTPHNNDRCQMEYYHTTNVMHGKKSRYSPYTDNDYSNNIKRFCVTKDLEHSENFVATRCRPYSLSAPELRTNSNPQSTSGAVINSFLSHMLQYPSLSPSQALDHDSAFGVTSTFQYVLVAATSIATKVHEETLTYLNQGQPYEIKIRTTDFSESKERLYKSIIRVGFHERRLQYMEKEQITEWQQQRPGERILEIDIPLSYGILEITNCPQNINTCEFLWNPAKETGVFVKVNCISTEFTPKKHGGEKGVPFRLQIETYATEVSCERLHAASCQVKVFKPKGADRKHKTDREKMGRRSQFDKEKYHPSYEYTILKELSLMEVWTPAQVSCSSHPSFTVSSPTSANSPISNNCSPQSPSHGTQPDSLPEELSHGTPATSTTELQEVPEAPLGPALPLSTEATTGETIHWLQQHRFSGLIKVFSNFSGADLLRLKRDDLIQICGLPNGIRLYNALHMRAVCPCLSIFVRLPSQQVFHAIYLENPKVSELISKINVICSFPADYICEAYVNGPAGIHILLTDEVIQNMVDESMFIIELLKDHSQESYGILLKACTNQH